MKNFIDRVKLLYHAPTVKVSINGWLSEPFPLGMGTQQGCWLSPLLYALLYAFVEPLDQSICTDPNLEGFCRGAFEERIGLYADDIILYLADLGSSLNRVLCLIDRFGKFSGLQINWSKSHILPLDPFHRTLQHKSLPLQWCSSIKYLGIEVTHHIPDFLIINVNPLIEFVRGGTFLVKATCL